MISALLSRLVILFFGTLYPAYASYKIVKSRDVRSYVKWMMYWIVFAIFTSAETFTDIFLCWFPFYYELKILIVFWLLSPATNGSSFLYRRFVHPLLTHHEEEIDEYLNKIKEHGYNTVVSLGSRGLNYAASTIMQTAVKSLPQLTIENNVINNQGTSNIDHVSETDSLLTTTSSERNVEEVEIRTDSDNDSDDEYLSEKVKKAKKQKTRSQPQRRSKRKGLST